MDVVEDRVYGGLMERLTINVNLGGGERLVVSRLWQ
jgi:hypothetical protein